MIFASIGPRVFNGFGGTRWRVEAFRWTAAGRTSRSPCPPATLRPSDGELAAASDPPRDRMVQTHPGRSGLPVDEMDVTGDPADIRRALRERCPAEAGVYGMVDDAGELVYVGKSKALRNRLISYFPSAADMEKSGRIAATAARLVWETCPGELIALLRELELIRRFRPRYNVRGQPRRRRPIYLCLGRSPAAYAYLTPRPSESATHVYGPFGGTRRRRRQVDAINDTFGLRDCPAKTPIVFSDEPALFPIVENPKCLRAEMNACAAPCAGRISAKDYAARVDTARRFLDGDDDAPLKRLTEEMNAAAAERRYEVAARVRDRLTLLTDLRGRLDHLRVVRDEYRFVYPLRDAGGTEAWMLIDGGRVAGLVAAPHDAETRRQCRAAVRQVFSPQPSLSSLVEEDAETTLIIAQWFRQHEGELARTIAPDEALRAARGRRARLHPR